VTIPVMNTCRHCCCLREHGDRVATCWWSQA